MWLRPDRIAWRRIVGLLVLQAVALAAPCRPEAAPFVARYEATWGGAPAGEIAISLDDDGGRYRNTLVVYAVGLARWLSGFRAIAESAGAFDALDLEPAFYDARYDLRRRREKRVGVRFVDHGAARLATPVAYAGIDTTAVPESLRRGVIDPLSALTRVRSSARAGRLATEGSTTLEVFDGKRRFNVVIAAVRPIIADQPQRGRALDLELHLKPVTLAKEQDDDDDIERVVRLVIADDTEATPLELSTTIAWAPLVIRFAGICVALDTCLDQR